MTVVAASVCAVSLSSRSAVAGEISENKSTEVEVEEESPAIFEAGFDLDYFSAYVWRNAVQNDRMALQPCVWADLTYFEPFWLGFSVWQNYDLTHRRASVYRRSLTETDYNVHVGATVWESEDEEFSLGLELGHEWYEQQYVRSEEKGGCPNTRELYAKATFDNPFVNLYGQASWMYKGFGDYSSGFHYELGFTREVELCDALVLGADWNISWADGRYLEYLYGGVSAPYLAEVEDDSGAGTGAFERYDDYDQTPKDGFAGTTIKLYLTWSITDWMSLGGTVAYTGVLNGALRESIGDQGKDYDFYGSEYPRDFFWGGVSLNLQF